MDQERVIEEVFAFYGDRLRALSMDKTGVGLPIWQHMDAKPAIRARIKGYGFSEKRAVEFDDRVLTGRETRGTPSSRRTSSTSPPRSCASRSTPRWSSCPTTRSC